MLNLELDHLGVIVRSIEKETEIYKKLGYREAGAVFQDENQKMRGLFLQPLQGGGHCLELIEDTSESKALANLLNAPGGRIYHLAYKVHDLEKELPDILATLNARILSPVKEATYYKKVCFIFLANGQIIELVEYR